LAEKGYLSEAEFSQVRAAFLTQQATLQSADATIKKAKTNLNYATIRSPIKGKVIQRNVEVGQTVAASFSSPTLFVIAESLKKMEILASVDEADIGSIHRGDSARFTVQAYPERTFGGAVTQIRLQPAVVQNVVTYTVVLATDNSDGALLPGMTATIRSECGAAVQTTRRGIGADA
jgi:HlyD family secretion protein